MQVIDRSPFLRQFVPLSLTGIIFGILVIILYFFINFLNLIPFATPIVLVPRPVDIVVGMTIYLKTAIDFAIFMGRLMDKNPGWKGRIAIELGTALGNAAGTLVVIALWVLFKEIDILLALMVFLASLVLFELAHGGMEHLAHWENQSFVKRYVYKGLHVFLDTVLRFIEPLLRKVLPDLGAKLKGVGNLGWQPLFMFSMSVPFILGLDDFAGYVPLFNVINVFGIAIGVFAAHTLLNVALFISPPVTIKAVKNEYISFVGTLAFIGLAFYGFYEVFRIINHMF
jgi:hypothetical protein